MAGCVDPATGECHYIKDPSCADEDECPFNNNPDRKTIPLSLHIADVIEEELGVTPHIVINHLLR